MIFGRVFSVLDGMPELPRNEWATFTSPATSSKAKQRLVNVFRVELISAYLGSLCCVKLDFDVERGERQASSLA